MMFLKFKKEFVKSKYRKIKKRNSRKIFIKQINSKFIIVNFLKYFLKKNKIFINYKILKELLIFEKGSYFSLQN